ncbi:hypothetical protein AWN88_22570 [Agrobacterium tumefaciens]|nr:hypothetical protein AWN88_22570 [Agrobacterium tumefaciens]KAJ35062.1 hypothetical protein BW45_00165 [Agrobacterium tumefaciens]
MFMIRKYDVVTGEFEDVEVAEPPFSEEEARVSIRDLSPRQFYHQAAIAGLITEAEALAAVTVKELPVILKNAIATLPENERFAATILISGATTFQRSSDLAALVGQHLSMSPAEIDAFWLAASRL